MTTITGTLTITDTVNPIWNLLLQGAGYTQRPGDYRTSSYEPVLGVDSEGNVYYYPVIPEPIIFTRTQFTVSTTIPASTPSPVPATWARLPVGNWSTHARSVDPLSTGSYFKFTADQISGGCLSLGVRAKDGAGIHMFSHGLIVDVEGIRVYEGGRFISRMRYSHSPLSDLRIYRQEDNTIVYVATTESEVVVYTSGAICPFPSFVDMYIYGHLYASGDRITSATYATGRVQYGSA